MSDVTRYEGLMLEHLYGLLDAAEAHDLEAFLATPEGELLRIRSRDWQAKLASVSRTTFPNLSFSPPAEPKLTLPVRPAPCAATTMKIVWTRWIVAASLLLVFGGLGGPAAYQLVGWYAQSSETESARVDARTAHESVKTLDTEHQAAREAIRIEHDRAVAAHQAAKTAYLDALASARKAIDQKDFVVRLRGPDRIQPGAPNEWLIDTLTKQGGYGSPKKIEVVVKDQKDKELLHETHGPTHGTTRLKLPVSFWDKIQAGDDLFLQVVAYTDDDRRSVLAERIPLARPVYVTQLVTDKPLYKPGEIVRFRSLTLDRATFLPPANDQMLKFRLRKPDGAMFPIAEGNGRLMDGLKPVIGPDGKPVRGIGAGEYELPVDAPGGEYTLEVVETNPATGRDTLLDARKFLVNRYVPDIFEKRLEFDGKSYGPGDYVQARLEVSRTAGGPMKDAKAVVNARIDGKTVFSDKNVHFQIQSEGTSGQTKAVLDIRFQIPADLYANRGLNKGPMDAVLDVAVLDGSDTENIVRPIPLVEKDLKVEFFPEGGDLVAGVPCRVYFQVRTPRGKPADIKGALTDGKTTLAEVATLTDAENPGVNRGQGVFTFTPRVGTKYFLKLRTPVGINEPTKEGFPLPEAKPDGVVLTAMDPVTEMGAPIRVRVQVGNGPKTLHIGAYARGRLIAQQQAEVEAGKPIDLQLQGDESLGGVTRITVFEEIQGQAGQNATLMPRAERLVYRKPGKQLLLTVNPDKNRYAPAGKVRIDIGAVNEKEKPTPAIVMIGVINQSVIAMADNKTDRLLPTHFLIAGEVKNPADLEHADFLLTDHPKAGVALDLLLGTQGWRRFAEQNILPNNPTERRDVVQLLVAHGRGMSAPLELYQLEQKRVTADYQPKVEQASLRLSEAESRWNAFRTKAEPDFRNRLAAAQAKADFADKHYQASSAELYRFETRAATARSWALPLFLLGLIVVICGGAALAITRTGKQRRAYFATSGGSLALAVLVLIAIVTTRGTSESELAFARQQLDDRNNAVVFGPRPPGTVNGAAAANLAKADAKQAEPERPVPAVGEGFPPPAPKGGGPNCAGDAAHEGRSGRSVQACTWRPQQGHEPEHRAAGHTTRCSRAGASSARIAPVPRCEG